MSELARAGEWLTEWAQRQALPEDVVFSIRLCLEEILANIVMHGFSPGDHTISVGLHCEGSEALVTVIDDGKPFDPLAAAAEIQGTSLADAALGGRGLILVKSYANRLAYGRDDGCNRLVMGFTLPGETPRPDK